MVGAHQNLNVSCDLTTPLHEWFVTRGLALATINLCTKVFIFEVSISTHYEDIKRRHKISKMGWFGIGRVTEGQRYVTKLVLC